MTDTNTATRTVTKIKPPSMWKVILHNDDYTPLEFVVELLQVVFNKTPPEATQIAQYVHDRGRAQVGLYTREIAETKTALAQRIAEDYEHPLLTTSEQA
jgi:ATP-dependent Clp protease adaptor protein ClpS